MVETCNLWRNWDDIEDIWSNVTNILKWFSDNQDRIANYSGPGHWNDPDMVNTLILLKSSIELYKRKIIVAYRKLCVE